MLRLIRSAILDKRRVTAPQHIQNVVMHLVLSWTGLASQKRMCFVTALEGTPSAGVPGSMTTPLMAPFKCFSKLVIPLKLVSGLLHAFTVVVEGCSEAANVQLGFHSQASMVCPGTALQVLTKFQIQQILLNWKMRTKRFQRAMKTDFLMGQEIAEWNRFWSRCCHNGIVCKQWGSKIHLKGECSGFLSRQRGCRTGL